MASNERKDKEAECIACPCPDCNCLRILSERTVRDHLDRTKSPEGKRRKVDNGYLHQFTSLTVQALCVRILTLYNQHSGMTQQCVTDLCELIRELLGSLVPSDHIPQSFKELQRLVDNLMVPVHKMTACPNECALFDGNTHRCMRNQCQGPGEPKVYHYLPLIPRLRQMFENADLSKCLQSHQHSGSNSEGEMRDIHDSPEWKALYGKGGEFEGEPRCIALEFSADGFAPFHHTTTDPYSVEHQASVVLNLPPNMRCKPGFNLLHGLIPGPTAPKEEAYNIYLRPLVDEMKVLKKGVQVYDAYRKETFLLRAIILLQVHDFPGQAKVLQGQGSAGKCACPMCRAEGIYSHDLRKVIHRSGREFLDKNDKLRDDETFPGGGVEKKVPVMRNFARERIMTAQHGVLLQMAKDTPAGSVERRMATKCSALAVKMGARKRSSEFELLGPMEVSKLAVEGMHTIQGVAKNVHGLLNGHSDGPHVRNHEKNIGRFEGCYPDDRGRIPDAPFTLCKESKKVADARLGNIYIPPGKGSLPKEAFGNYHSMKSHTWHMVLLKGVYPYTLRGLLGERQRKALIKFCHILTLCASRVIYLDIMPRIERNFHHCLSLMDREYPETLKTILWHMLRHFPKFIMSYGPLHSYWMFFFERQIHHHVARMHNTKHPEVSMINAHRIDALCTLLSMQNRSCTSVKTGVSATLTAAHQLALQRRYMEMNAQRGITFHRLCRNKGTDSTFTTEEESSLRKPTKEVLKWFSHDGSSWIWKGEEKWGDKASVVSKRDPVTGLICFGRVQFFLRHTFMGKDYTFAFVNWFDVPRVDVESMLYVFEPDSSHPYLNQFTTLDELSEPHILASDNGSKEVFVLDFMDKTRCVELLGWIEDSS